jgi:hypothetical protein
VSETWSPARSIPCTFSPTSPGIGWHEPPKAGGLLDSTIHRYKSVYEFKKAQVLGSAGPNKVVRIGRAARWWQVRSASGSGDSRRTAVLGALNVDELTVGQATVEKPAKQPEGTRAEELLKELAARAMVFRAADGRFYARVPVNGRQAIFGLKSTAFRDWLIDGYVSAHQQLPPRRVIRRVLEALEARARFESDGPTVYVRVGRDRDDKLSSYYLDLGDHEGTVIKICAGGWSIADETGIHFARPQGQLPMPVPEHDGSIELLREFVNVNESDFRLLVCWMAFALRPVGPYPVLVLHGNQATAKSSLVTVIRQLIDPQTAPHLAESRSTGDLMITAVNGWLLAFDNLSSLPNWLSDSLCRLASGSGFATRALFSNEERHIIYAQRPIILSGIDEFVRRGDLADRAVFLHLPLIIDSQRREEVEFWGTFREARPKILGALLDAVAGALRELPSVQLAKLPRMADFARFGEAVGRGLGWAPETFLAAYLDNRQQATLSTLEDSILANTLLKIKENCWGMVEWSMPASEMLAKLTLDLDRSIAKSPRWPKTPNMLSSELRRLAPTLAEHGLFVIFKRTEKQRSIILTTQPHLHLAEATIEANIPAG